MSSAQPLPEADVMELVAKASLSQIKETPTKHLVQAYNAISGREAIQKFSTREVAEDRTFDAIMSYREKHPEIEQGEPVTQDFEDLTEEQQREAVASSAALATETTAEVIVEEATKVARQFRIKLPFTGKSRAPKKNSKRAKVLELMLDGFGVLPSELTTGQFVADNGEPIAWTPKDAYEGIRHIHVSLGYGLDQYPDGRIYAHTDLPGAHFAHEQKPERPMAVVSSAPVEEPATTETTTFPETDEGE